MLNELFNATHAFDKQRQGYYDEESQCLFVKECDETKNCIRNQCSPQRDAFGGGFYNGCVQACNADRFMTSYVDEHLCKNPHTTYKLYGIQCEGYTPGGVVSILGRDVSVIQIISALLIIFIIYFVAKKI